VPLCPPQTGGTFTYKYTLKMFNLVL
jgi:hypothetical protein